MNLSTDIRVPTWVWSSKLSLAWAPVLNTNMLVPFKWSYKVQTLTAVLITSSL